MTISKVLTTSQPTDGADVDRALANGAPIDYNSLIVVRYLQSQIDALTARMVIQEARP